MVGTSAITFTLIIIGLEVLFLTTVKRKPLTTVLLAVMPGVAMLMALRGALGGAAWSVIAFWLTVSLPLHIADLRHRRLL
jgi:hypothetical protein